MENLTVLKWVGISFSILLFFIAFFASAINEYKATNSIMPIFNLILDSDNQAYKIEKSLVNNEFKVTPEESYKSVVTGLFILISVYIMVNLIIIILLFFFWSFIFGIGSDKGGNDNSEGFIKILETIICTFLSYVLLTTAFVFIRDIVGEGFSNLSWNVLYSMIPLKAIVYGIINFPALIGVI